MQGLFVLVVGASRQVLHVVHQSLLSHYLPSTSRDLYIGFTAEGGMSEGRDFFSLVDLLVSLFPSSEAKLNLFLDGLS